MISMKVGFKAGAGSSPFDFQGKNDLRDVMRWVDGNHERFEKAVVLTHRKSVFQILTFLIRICPVDTGRLRGSWTPFFDKYGNASYQKWLADTSRASYPTKAPKRGFSQEQVQQGKADGTFTDQALATTISSNVKYAEYADAKVGFMARAVQWGQELYLKNFGALLDKSAEAGWIGDVDPNVEGGTQ